MGVQGGTVLVPARGQWKRGSGKGANAHTRGGKMGRGVVYSLHVQSMHVDGGVGRWGKVLRLRHLLQCSPLQLLFHYRSLLRKVCALPYSSVLAAVLVVCDFLSSRGQLMRPPPQTGRRPRAVHSCTRQCRPCGCRGRCCCCSCCPCCGRRCA